MTGGSLKLADVLKIRHMPNNASRFLTHKNLFTLWHFESYTVLFLNHIHLFVSLFSTKITDETLSIALGLRRSYQAAECRKVTNRVYPRVLKVVSGKTKIVTFCTITSGFRHGYQA